MKNRVGISLIFFLFLFFASLGDPIVHLGSLLKRIPNLDPSAQVVCVRKALPDVATILFFSQTDYTVNWNAYNFVFTRDQYYLVPRVLEYREAGPVDMKAYNWYLAYRLDAGAIDQIARENHLQILQTCGNITVLSRAN